MIPKVSVIFSFYNDSKYLDDSITSILNQTFKDIELIMLDNGSTDDSFEIANEYTKTDYRVKIIRSEINYYGGGKNSRALLKEAKGKYIKFFCADDVMLPNCIEKQVNFLDDNSKYIACFANLNMVDDNGKNLNKSSDCVIKNNRFEYLNHIFFNYNALTFPTFIIRKEYLEESMMDLRLLHFYDVKLWISTLKKGEIFVIEENLVNYRIQGNGGNVSNLNADPKKLKTYLFELHLIYEEFFKIDDFDDFEKIFPNHKDKIKNCDRDKDKDLIPLIIALILYNSDKFNPFLFCLHKNIALLKIFDLLRSDKIFAKMEGKLGVSYKDIRDLSMTFFEGIDIKYLKHHKGFFKKLYYRIFKKRHIKKAKELYSNQIINF